MSLKYLLLRNKKSNTSGILVVKYVMLLVLGCQGNVHVMKMWWSDTI